MKSKLLILSLLFFSTRSLAQWEAGPGFGISIPITGYGKVVNTGALIFNLDGKYRLKPGFALGMKTQMARFAKDEDANDAYHGAKITVAPILFTAEYAINPAAKVQPYLTAGLGLSFFAISYNSSATSVDDHSISNVSFTMMPLFGLRYTPGQQLYIFLESGFILLADGPPMGFPESDKMTGYNYISAGIQYRFGKQ
jgi:opacity protein-like surface antigen